MNNEINIESITNYHAKKKIVLEALRHFRKYKECASVKINSKYADGEYKLSVRRTDLIYKIGYDFTTVEGFKRLVEDKKQGERANIIKIFNYLSAMNNYLNANKGN